MLKKYSVKWLIITICAIIGSVLGQLIGLILPQGVVRDFFIRAAAIGIEPTKIDLSLFSITFGFMIRVNIIGIIGIAVAAYFLRWFR